MGVGGGVIVGLPFAKLLEFSASIRSLKGLGIQHDSFVFTVAIGWACANLHGPPALSMAMPFSTDKVCLLAIVCPARSVSRLVSAPALMARSTRVTCATDP